MKKISLFHILRITIFILLISIPFIAGITGTKSETTAENRKLNKQPDFNIKSWQSFPKEYENYFADTFAFRIQLIRLHNFINIIVLRSSPRSNVIIGKNNWFFFNSEGPQQQEKYFTENDLAIIFDNLEKTSNVLTGQGIKFYLFVTPNSQSIYPENMPPYLNSGKESRLDKLIAHLKHNHSSVSIIDPRSEIKEGKTQYLTYRKFDTHWNDYGAFLAYQKLLNTISSDFPDVKPYELKNFSISYKKTANTDLLGMLAINGYSEEQAPTLSLKNGALARQTIVSCKYKPNCEKIRTTVNNSTLPKLLMYRDSFSNHLVPFIGEHFSDALFVWSYKTKRLDLVEQKPDIVIYQVVERNLAELKKQQLSFEQ